MKYWLLMIGTIHSVINASSNATESPRWDMEGLQEVESFFRYCNKAQEKKEYSRIMSFQQSSDNALYVYELAKKYHEEEEKDVRLAREQYASRKKMVKYESFIADSTTWSLILLFLYSNVFMMVQTKR